MHNKDNAYILVPIVLILLFTLSFAVVIFFLETIEDNKTGSLTTKDITFEDVQNMIESLPPSDFKSNLLVVLAAEFANDSPELRKLLMIYAQMKVEELLKNNSI